MNGIRYTITGGVCLGMLAVLLAGCSDQKAQAEHAAGKNAGVPATPAFIEQCNQAYYNLRREGVTGLECRIDDLGLAKKLTTAAPDSRERALLAGLGKVHYRLTMDSNGFRVSPRGIPAVTGSQREVIDGTVTMMEGFLSAWGGTIARPVLDPSRSYTVYRTEDGGYRVVLQDGGESRTLTLASDYRLVAVREVVGEGTIDVRTTYTQSDRGFVLKSSEMRFDAPGDVATVKHTTAFQTIEGLVLPVKVSFVLTDRGTTRTDEFLLSSYRITNE